MALIKAINYDPAVVVNKSLSTMIPMTALDTTNLRITFTAPESGNVLVRLQGVTDGFNYVPRLFLGILEGSTVRMRLGVMGTGNWYNGGSAFVGVEAVFVQTGLTPGVQYTWDAAYGTDGTSGNTLRYGGPNDAVASNAGGAFIFEIWEA